MTGVEDKLLVRLAGAARPSSTHYSKALDEWASKLGKPDGMLLPPRRAIPVYQDLEGNPVLIQAGPTSPVAYDFPGGFPAPAEGISGGYVPAVGADMDAAPDYDRLTAQAMVNGGQLAVPDLLDGPESSTDLKGAILEWASDISKEMAQSLLQNSLSNLFLQGGPLGVVGPVLGALNGSLSGLAGGLGPAARAIGSAIESLSGGAGGFANSLGFASGGCFPSPSNGLPAAISASDALSQLGGQLLSAWKVQDSDSTGEQLAHHFANKWKGKLQDPQAALDKLKGYFSATAAPAIFAAIRMGDMDSASDPVLIGDPTVSVEGQSLARVGDLVKPPGVQVYLGAATVLTGGQMTARVTSTTQVGPFSKGAATVFVNGPCGGSPPSPRKPPESPNSSSTSNTDKGGTSQSQKNGKVGDHREDAVSTGKSSSTNAEKALSRDSSPSDVDKGSGGAGSTGAQSSKAPPAGQASGSEMQNGGGEASHTEPTPKQADSNSNGPSGTGSDRVGDKVEPKTGQTAPTQDEGSGVSPSASSGTDQVADKKGEASSQTAASGTNSATQSAAGIPSTTVSGSGRDAGMTTGDPGKVTGDLSVDLQDKIVAGPLGSAKSPTLCGENDADRYACSHWHCTNNCLNTREDGSLKTRVGAAAVEIIQGARVDYLNDENLRNSAYQCSDYYDNSVGREIAKNQAYNDWTCAAACANELGRGEPSKGYRSSDLPEGGTERPFGPKHPDGSNTCEPTYFSYEKDPNSIGLVRPKENAPEIPKPADEFKRKNQ